MIISTVIVYGGMATVIGLALLGVVCAWRSLWKDGDEPGDGTKR
jgi:hypothetical protein